MPRQLPVVSGRELVRALEQAFGYQIVRQRGSHIRLRTDLQDKHSLTIPDHQELDRGTLNGILNEIARHLERDKDDIVSTLFGKEHRVAGWR